jgi:hypothetical protein
MEIIDLFVSTLAFYIFSHKEGYCVRYVTAMKGPPVTYEQIISVGCRLFYGCMADIKIEHSSAR